MSRGVLIFGARGLLGTELVAAAAGSGVEAIGVDLPECDIREPAAVGRWIREAAPALVCNAAAFTDVDAAETRSDEAFAINAIGAENVALAAAGLALPLVHFSTDFVFDGEAGRPYDEFDDPAPLSVYGRSKRAGEELVLRAWPRSAVVRTAYLYGRCGRNFGSTVVARLRRGETIRADRERRVAPTWARRVAEAALAIAATGRGGIWHAGCEGEATWFDFARAAADGLGIPGDIRAASTAGLRLAARRPRCSLLDDRMLRLHGLPPMPSWREALRGYLEEERSGVPGVLPEGERA